MDSIAVQAYRGSWFAGWRRFLLINLKVLTVIAVLLLTVRAVLPFYIQRYVNRTLDRIPEYEGSIGDVDLSLWRGAYSIESIKLLKSTGKVPVPFFASRRADFSVEWGALLAGKVVGELIVEEGELNFVNGPNDAQSQTRIDGEWLEAVKDLFPLRINRFELRNGEVHYRDFHTSPNIDVVMTGVHAVGRNLSNTSDPTYGAVASIAATGKIEKTAPVSIESTLDPSAKTPTFDLDLKIDSLPAPRLNDFFRGYGGFDTESGEIGVFAEMAAKNGEIKGYIKPLLHDVALIDPEQDSGLVQTAWESIVAVVAELFENQKRDQVATAIPFSGRIDNVEIGSWSAFLGILKNAFVRGLEANLEGSISLDDFAGTKEGSKKSELKR